MCEFCCWGYLDSGRGDFVQRAKSFGTWRAHHPLWQYPWWSSAFAEYLDGACRWGTAVLGRLPKRLWFWSSWCRGPKRFQSSMHIWNTNHYSLSVSATAFQAYGWPDMFLSDWTWSGSFRRCQLFNLFGLWIGLVDNLFDRCGFYCFCLRSSVWARMHWTPPAAIYTWLSWFFWCFCGCFFFWPVSMDVFFISSASNVSGIQIAFGCCVEPMNSVTAASVPSASGQGWKVACKIPLGFV